MGIYQWVENAIVEENYQEPHLPFPENQYSEENLFPRLQGTYLAHGSYGACSEPNLILYQQWQTLIESNPNLFYYDTLYPHLVRSIRHLAKFVGCEPINIQLVTNVENGMQSVLNSLDMKGFAIQFDVNYGATTHALEFICKEKGMEVLKVS